MNRRRLFALPALLIALNAQAAGDWNQWRGPNRNGVLPDSPPLADKWPADGPAVLWDSESIPSNDDGGHGSVVAADGRAYISVVWHVDTPTETRAIDDLVLRKLGYRGVNSLGKDLVARMEEERMNLNPRLRGSRLDAWANEWVEKNLDRKQKQNLGSWIVTRFKKGKAAISIATLERLNAIRKRRFADEAEMMAWVREQDFGEDVERQILKAVPNTMKVAKDTVVCIDLETGRTLWKTAAPGTATGRNSSSTPCVADGRVYSIGSGHAHCMDAKSGKLIWSAETATKGTATSPTVVDGMVVFIAGSLTALDAGTGKRVWNQKKVSGGNASPAVWRSRGKSRLLCNGRRELACVDPATGDILWTMPGGGDSTPSVSGDFAAVYSRTTAIGLSAYRLSEKGAVKLWSHVLDARRTQSSPIIHEGHVYFMGGGFQMCVGLESGEIKWKHPENSNISSPMLADGKIFVFGKRASDLQMVKATPDERQELGAAKVRAMWCPSPTVSNGRILLRLDDRIRCYNAASPEKGGADLR